MNQMNNFNAKHCLATCMLLVFFAIMSMTPSSAQNTTSSQSEIQNPAASDSSPGTLLYSDDFSSSKSGWEIVTSGDFIAGYKKGVYHITIVPEDYWDGTSAPNLELGDLAVEVEAKKEAGSDDNVYGIWMRNQGNGSFYAFLISSDGYFEYAKKDNGTWVTPSNWTKSGAIKTGEETNRLKVVAKGDKFDFYDNDVLLDSYVDSQFKTGWLGLWVGTQSEGNVTIGFDNFKVWSLKD